MNLKNIEKHFADGKPLTVETLLVQYSTFLNSLSNPVSICEGMLDLIKQTWGTETDEAARFARIHKATEAVMETFLLLKAEKEAVQKLQESHSRTL